MYFFENDLQRTGPHGVESFSLRAARRRTSHRDDSAARRRRLEPGGLVAPARRARRDTYFAFDAPGTAANNHYVKFGKSGRRPTGPSAS